MHKIKRELKNSYVPNELSFEERLIAAIKKHTCLYNKQSISYRRRSVKQNAWHKVAYDVRSDVKECQHRWRSLRDRYVREIRTNSNCKWKYMSNLSFLNAYFDSRNNSNNITVSDETNTTIDHEEKKKIDREEKKKVVKQKGSVMPNGKKKRVSEKTELEMEDSDIEIDKLNHTKDQPITKSSTLRLEIDELQEEAPSPMTFVEFINNENIREIDSVDVNKISEVNLQKIGNEVKSRNEDYYKTLDSFMLQLPFIVQDDLKIEILNRVYCEVKKRKILNN